MNELTRLAALNNAEWCDIVCRAHGRPGDFSDALWFNRRATPPFYPNVVTLIPEAGPALQDLVPDMAKALPEGFAVKDSFATLDLEPLGFRALFEATWIARRPGNAGVSSPLAWRKIVSDAELAAWHSAWTGGVVDEMIFPPALLYQPAVTLIAGFAGDRIVAGAALNRSDQAMGWSNVFMPETDALACRAAALSFAAGIAGDLPLVGYERGIDLDQSLQIGFEALGPLRVSFYEGVSSMAA